MKPTAEISRQAETPKVVVIVQARMSSTRLPGKVMRQVLGKPLLAYLVERLQRIKNSHQLVIATSTAPEDDVIATFCEQNKVDCFRGSLFDVLDRYVQAARKNHADLVVRICSDCPLFDPAVAESVIEQAFHTAADWTSNVTQRSFPRGMEVEVCRMHALEQAHQESSRPEEREHVTPYLYRHPELFSLSHYVRVPPLPDYRLCVDTIEDFQLIKNILEALHLKKNEFSIEDVVDLLDEHPDWLSLNAHVKQKAL